MRGTAPPAEAERQGAEGAALSRLGVRRVPVDTPPRRRVRFKSKNVFSRQYAGEERHSYEEEKSKSIWPTCRDFFGDTLHPKKLRKRAHRSQPSPTSLAVPLRPLPSATLLPSLLPLV